MESSSRITGSESPAQKIIKLSFTQPRRSKLCMEDLPAATEFIEPSQIRNAVVQAAIRKCTLCFSSGGNPFHVLDIGLRMRIHCIRIQIIHSFIVSYSGLLCSLFLIVKIAR